MWGQFVLTLKSNLANSNSANISLSIVYMQNTLQDPVGKSKMKIELQNLSWEAVALWTRYLSSLC